MNEPAQANTGGDAAHPGEMTDERFAAIWDEYEAAAIDETLDYAAERARVAGALDVGATDLDEAEARCDILGRLAAIAAEVAADLATGGGSDG